MKDIMSLLFETNAFKIAEENNPFWYTSGKIGPYFINADYLYGSESDSKELLEYIDNQLENINKEDIPTNIFKKVLEHYNNNEIYKSVIDYMKNYIEQKIDVSQIDYISGGERRDWYFSNIMAYLLNKPHVTIYKDLSTVLSNSTFTENNTISNIENKKFLHLADLLNQSASFTRAWIPAIKNLGSNIVWSVFAVDRMQGGTETLSNDGVKVYSLLQIDESLFQKAFSLGIINNEQLNVLKSFKEDPDGTMKNFLITHPEFLENSLNSDNEKTKKRAKLLVEQNIYGLNS